MKSGLCGVGSEIGTFGQFSKYNPLHTVIAKVKAAMLQHEEIMTIAKLTLS